MTLEHAPPRTLGGKEVCLTCRSCNRAASRHLDQAVAMLKKEIANRRIGRRTMELHLFGSTYTFSLWSEGSQEIARPHANDPTMKKFLQGKSGVIAAASFRVRSVDREQGIKARLRPPPNERHVAVCLLRAAFLMVFSLLGGEGSRYIESEPIRPIREQIMKPDDDIVPMLLCDFKGGEDFTGDLIALNFGCRPHFWAVKITDLEVGILLPCGGSSIEEFEELVRDWERIKSDIHLCRLLPTRFGSRPVVKVRDDVNTTLRDGDLIGLKREDEEGRHWIVVDSQGSLGTAIQLQSA